MAHALRHAVSRIQSVPSNMMSVSSHHHELCNGDKYHHDCNSLEILVARR